MYEICFHQQNFHNEEIWFCVCIGQTSRRFTLHTLKCSSYAQFFGVYLLQTVYNLIGGWFCAYCILGSCLYLRHMDIYICINKHERTHMYLSRLFILFHFNIAIDVIAVVGICLFVSFSPLWIFQFMRNWCWCASVRNVKVMLYYKSFQCCFFSIGVQHPENPPSAFGQTTAAMVPMLIRRWQCADNEIYIQMNWCKVIQIWNFCFRCYTKLNRHHRNYAKIHFKAANM